MREREEQFTSGLIRVASASVGCIDVAREARDCMLGFLVWLCRVHCYRLRGGWFTAGLSGVGCVGWIGVVRRFQVVGLSRVP